jgi:hypothetical protein
LLGEAAAEIGTGEWVGAEELARRYLPGDPLWRDNAGVDQHLACLGPLRVGQRAVLRLELRYRRQSVGQYYSGSWDCKRFHLALNPPLGSR